MQRSASGFFHDGSSIRVRALARHALAASLVVSMAAAQSLGTVTNTFQTPANLTPFGLDWSFNLGTGTPTGLYLTAAGTTDSVHEIEAQGATAGTSLSTVNITANSGNPMGVTLNPTSGERFVTDANDQDVDIYDMNWNYLASFPVGSETTFPEGIAYSLVTQNLYVVDAAAPEVEEYTFDPVTQTWGHLTTYPVNGSSVDGIAYVAASDQFWAYDSGTDHCRLYDNQFHEIASFPGTASLALGNGEGVAVIGNSLYVCASSSDTIVEFHVDPALLPSGLEAVVETTLNTGTLSADPYQTVVDNQFLRWQLTDTTGLQNGNICAVIMNIGGADLPIGVSNTPGFEIPGFNQLWSLSNPAGQEFVLPPVLVGQQASMFVPAGIFDPGTKLRIQGLTFAPSVTPLPVLPTLSTITFQFPCGSGEDFDSITSPGVGVYPTGWSTGAGVAWSSNSGGTPSLATGPGAATSGAIYMYCESSGPNIGGTFEMDSAMFPTAGITQVSFDLSRVGVTIGTLTITYTDATGAFTNTLGSWTGPGTSEWENITLPIGNVGAMVQFKFHYVAGSSFTGDVAVDTWCLQ